MRGMEGQTRSGASRLQERSALGHSQPPLSLQSCQLGPSVPGAIPIPVPRAGWDRAVCKTHPSGNTEIRDRDTEVS